MLRLADRRKRRCIEWEKPRERTAQIFYSTVDDCHILSLPIELLQLILLRGHQSVIEPDPEKQQEESSICNTQHHLSPCVQTMARLHASTPSRIPLLLRTNHCRSRINFSSSMGKRRNDSLLCMGWKELL